MTLVPRFIEAGLSFRAVQRYQSRTLYTDGSYDNGVAGWAVVEDGECIHQDWGRGVTSNMAEGHALVAALRLVQGVPATILTDSQGWVAAITQSKRAKGKGAKEILDEALNLFHSQIELVWVPAHTGVIAGNELADSYAKEARLNKRTSPAHAGLGITSQHGFPDLKRRALVDVSQTARVSY